MRKRNTLFSPLNSFSWKFNLANTNQRFSFLIVEKYTVDAPSGNGDFYNTDASGKRTSRIPERFRGCVYANPHKNYAVAKMSGFVKAWPERLIKNKSQRYERWWKTWDDYSKTSKRDWKNKCSRQQDFVASKFVSIYFTLTEAKNIAS